MKQADLDAVAALVSAQLEQFAASQPQRTDPAAIGKMADQVIVGMQDYIKRCMAPLVARVAELERRQ
jgi:hypothetical protein